MRRFLLQMLLVVVVLLTINFIYSFTVGGKLRAYAKKYLSLKSPINLLILGDSRAAMAWATNTNKTVYNFANGSDNITDMHHKFRFASADNSKDKDKFVVLSFEAHFISFYRETKQNNRMNAILNNRYLNIHLVNAMPLFFDPETEFDFKRFVLSFTNQKKVDSTTLYSRASARSRMNMQFPDSRVSKRLLTEFQDLIDDIRVKGYKIIAIKYPVHPYFDSLIATDPRSIHLNAVTDSLAHANGLEVFDFSEIIYDPKLFIDQDHLNRAGSDLFNKTFTRLFLKTN